MVLTRRPQFVRSRRSATNALVDLWLTFWSHPLFWLVVLSLAALLTFSAIESAKNGGSSRSGGSPSGIAGYGHDPGQPFAR